MENFRGIELIYYVPINMQRVIKELLMKRLILLFLNRSTILYFWISYIYVYFKKQKINYHIRVISTLNAFIKFLYKRIQYHPELYLYLKFYLKFVWKL